MKDPDLAQEHTKKLAKIEEWDTEKVARGKLEAHDNEQVAMSAGSGFDPTFGLLTTRRGRCFSLGLLISVLLSWALFHYWIYRPTPQQFSIYPLALKGAAWQTLVRQGMRAAQIPEAVQPRLMAQCKQDACVVPSFEDWKRVVPPKSVLGPEITYCEMWDAIRRDPGSPYLGKNRMPAEASTNWTVGSVTLTDGGTRPACFQRRPLSNMAVAGASPLKSLVLLAFFAVLVGVAIAVSRRLPPG